MNAALQAGRDAAALRPMREADVEAVHDVERRAYEFPWTAGIFRDCLRADYMAWLLERDGAVIGYFLMSLAAGEAHVLNIAVAPEHQGHGHGRRMLRSLVHLARARGAQRIFLEVRPSNTGAIALYHQEGFNEIGRRPRYYPARDGREDAIVMAMELLAEP
ncbi:ribosomal protein S18-alanine N-acetyltransferase [Lysobacter sp. N42]|uniref:ribosomal protein S18-alanine N-acetyltransferase n=1 Tax=Lysobacter sp. N42 TaxID=2545719 RepID=UPI001043CFC0|nr:ribosomal protein S18-alanine N-acetyltransferase [Lysobacter sp. N42]TCZ81847.1 ribosomal-protein-alanine N-acetyltransferase [Lysobacter sp. N42]